MKAVIMAAGEGKRLRPLTLTRPKPMIPIVGKPFLQIILEFLKEVGISDIILVVGYKQEQISQYFQDGSQFGLNIQYITQKDQLGTGHAALCAKELIQSEDFLLMNGDILISSETLIQLIQKFESLSHTSLISVKKIPDPSSYGIVKFNEDSEDVIKIIEKPSTTELSKDAYTNAGLYVFNPSIFAAIQQTPKSPRGEIEITDSIQILIDQGEPIKCFKIKDFWLDLGKPWDLLDANQFFLNRVKFSNQGSIEENVKVVGKVGIGKGTIIRSGSYLMGPLFIGQNCDIGPNCYIRDCCSIGNNVRIGHACEVKNSIIFDNSKIPHLSYIGDSIIGSDVNLGAGTITANLRFDKKTIPITIKGERVDSGRKKMGVIIGDGAQTGIGTTIMPGIKIGPNSIISANSIVKSDVPPETQI
ncbi:MAG: NTP transferase domain-containing protein [Candidatus Helarchaeota archaeon]|nr:NTP transferase domain-containing protein [Candidatus Helarchaeota archaeon]